MFRVTDRFGSGTGEMGGIQIHGDVKCAQDREVC